MHKTESICKNIIISLVSVILFFSLAEVFLFITGFNKRRYSNNLGSEKVFYNNPGKNIGKIVPKNQRRCSVDPFLFWKLNPLPGEVNSSGFRSKKEFPVNKREGEKRIICLGDSITYGTWVKTEETYPYILEQMLNAGFASEEFEVINAGVMGYSSLQGLRQLKRDLIKHKPDLVIAYFGLDDNFPAVVYSDKEQKTYNSLVFRLDNLLEKTRFYCFLKVYLVKIKNEFIANYVNPGQGADKSAKRRVEPEDYRHNLLEMVKIAKENNSKILFLTPVIFKLKEKEISYLEDYRRAIPQGYAVDPSGELNEYKKDNSLFLDGCHFTPAGHWVIAKVIHERLVEEQIANPKMGITNMPIPPKDYLPEKIKEGDLKGYIKMGENEIGALTFAWQELEKVGNRDARFIVSYNGNAFLKNVSSNEGLRKLRINLYSYIPNKVSVFVNDNYLDDFECPPNQWEEAEFQFEDNAKILKITICPQKSFKPSVEFGSKDDRTLSVAISRIEVTRL